MIYANYILNKIKHLPKAVFASGFPLKLKSKFKRNALNYTIHGKTVNGKNILPYPYYETTVTKNGVTFTDNGDGSITVNGTATANTNFQCSGLSSISMPQGNYILSSGVPDDDAKNALGLAFGYKIGDESRTVLYTIDGQSTITLNETAMCDIIIVIRKNQTVSNLVFKPMLELGDTATEYEKYTEYSVGDKTKNLIPYPYANTTKTVNGVTFTDNGDGSIIVNGTATANATFYIKTTDKNFKPSSTTLYISGCPAGGSLSTYRMTVNAFKQTESDYTYVVGASDIGNGALLNLTNKDYSQLELSITVFSGTTVNNLVFKPMLELGNTATDYEPYGYKIPLVNSGKNLIPYPYVFFGGESTKTINGITFTDNGDGSITVNGTSTLKTYFDLILNNDIIGEIDKTKTYTMSMPDVKNHNGNIALALHKGGTWVDNVCTLDFPTKDFSGYEKEFDKVQIKLIIGVNASFENLIFKPMLEVGDTATEYEPYRALDATNVYHNAQLKDGERINYKIDNLPELQLYKGENNITADTSITPVTIDIRYLN